jgi:hypothetical protein
MFSLNGYLVVTLFDSGVMHDFISKVSHPVFRLNLNAFLYVCEDQVLHIKRQIVE